MKRERNNGLRKVCEHPRRQWAKCAHPWHFNFRWRGVEWRFSLDKELGRRIDSRTDAETEADRIRGAIKAGTFRTAVPVLQGLTLRQLADTYLDRYVKVERAGTAQAFTWALATICRTLIPGPNGEGPLPLGEWCITDIVTDTIERFREERRGQGAGVVGVNRNLGSLRALFNWAVRVGYVERSPFKRGTEPVVKLSAEHGRVRRLDVDTGEEGRLLQACGSHLRAVVEAALETGMRRGEILSLQWSQVEGLTVDGSTLRWAPRAELVLPWAKTKTRRDRRIPISSRLKAVLELRRFGPDGTALPAEAYVFGNEIGQRVQNVKRAWQAAVLKAHGVTPAYTDTANLTNESRAALAGIDLHFHDLRREAGSRWLEGGVPLHTIRDWLGHTSIAQTSVYLAGTMATQHDAMRQYEARRAKKAKADPSAPRLQKIANRFHTEGRKGVSGAETRKRKPNKTAVDRDRAVM